MKPPHPFRSPHRRQLLCALALGALLSLGAAPAMARREGDHDQARQALAAGEVMPLRSLLQQLEREHPGQVLEVELEAHHGAWVYEIKLLQTDGQLIKLKLDARSGELLRRERKQR
jgi:uncharacterized membrane protein YkoI